MATVNKDFKIKSGLVVEGTTATVNGYDILTKKQDDQNYVVNLIGGTATSANEADKVVKRDGSGNFAAGVITADLVGDVTGTVSDISNHNTDSLSEGSNNLYYTDTRARGAFSEGLGIDIVNGEISVNTHGAIGDSSVSGLEVYPGTGPNAVSFVGIDRSVVNAWYDASGAASAAQSAAELTASNALSSAVTNLEGQIADAETNANTYTNTAITNLNLAGTYDALGAAADALSDANAYTDGKVADLVDSAPALLDTLNELAAAIADNPNYATDVANLIAGKQDTLTAGSNIDITQDTISVTGLDTDDVAEGPSRLYFTNTRAQDAIGAGTGLTKDNQGTELAINRQAVDTWYDAAGSAAAAQTAAEGYASGLDSATNTRIDNLDTDDVAEGSNLYFTDGRAKDSAAALLTTANLTNITITGTGNGGLTITAENGVADSDTDDLTEGTTNLYFTEQRALDAVSGSNIQPESVDITWVRREEATWTNVPTASTATVHSFATNKGSVKYLVRVISGSFSHVTEILATTDASNNVAVVEYGTIYTSENPLATATVVWDGQSAYNLNVTTANNNSEVLVAATLLAYND